MEKDMVNQKEYSVTYRVYSNKDARVKKANQIVLWSLTVSKCFLLLAFLAQIATGGANYVVVVVPCIVLFVGLLLDWGIYLRRGASEAHRYIMMGSFLLAYVWLNLAGGSSYVIIYIIPALVCCLLYYDRTFCNRIALVAAAAVVIRMVKEMVLTGAVDQMKFMMSFITLLMIFFFVWGAKIFTQFNYDIVETMQEEQNRQNVMMDDILQVAQITRESVEDTSGKMVTLQDSTSAVNQSLHEIAEGIASTAESIQEQSVMTGEIREAVRVAEENTTQVVDTAKSTAEQMDENSRRMDMLKEQSEEIEAGAIDVERAMEELKKKAEEVSEITQVIFSISEQTNLLALNASIESARAGEAGRGFAVVADQIRELSEQTKSSTEKIEKIVSQLNVDADTTADLVGKSLQATKQQKDLIEQNAVSFQDLRKQADALAGRADSLEEEIKRLLASNNHIVENITQLSAVSQQVTASTQEASELSENDLKELKNVAASIVELEHTVERLKKYYAE
jgi:methyl-accepting chemotaxis protein